ncbi:transglutaminase-like domain-containing protein [Streptacidiphilus carbonis]|jgi:transglutaminase-like putative cysteine protease|uniref:transglutaminase-like domain-containing protein n=1 Tax=Streptacidiphilus carbonis TaxID=105422 RepID=UPI0005A76ECE|nr:transglutaminase family protein [Streptacidiphilus carbonis]
MIAPLAVAPGDYLAADAVIDHTHPALLAKAAELRSAAGEVATARATFDFVLEQLPHSRDLGDWSAAYVASDVLAEGNAICHGKAHLFAALLRANGIPAGLCYQRLADDVPGGFVVHGLNAVLLEGRWVRLDARGGTPGAAARFSTDPADEHPAFPVDPALDEVDYPTVHPTTPPALLKGLQAAEPNRTGYGYYLPDAV